MMQILRCWRERARFCTIHGEDCAFKEKEELLPAQIRGEDFAFTAVGSEGILYKTQRYDIHRVVDCRNLEKIDVQTSVF